MVSNKYSVIQGLRVLHFYIRRTRGRNIGDCGPLWELQENVTLNSHACTAAWRLIYVKYIDLLK